VNKTIRRLMRRIFTRMYYLFRPTIVLFMSRTFLRSLNRSLLRLTMEANGMGFYSSNFSRTGELQLIEKLTSLKPKVFMDIGANNGTYSQMVLEKLQCHVIAFEPQTSCYKKLKSIADSTGRMSVFNYAIGAENGNVEIFFSGDEDQLATVSKESLEVPYLHNRHYTSEIVKVRTLDSFVLEFNEYSLGQNFELIDVMKVDVEGFELEVLLGAKSLISSGSLKAIILEYNYHHLIRSHTILDLHRLLEGYICYRIMPYGGIRMIDSANPIENVALYSNLVFIRNDLEFEFSQNL